MIHAKIKGLFSPSYVLTEDLQPLVVIKSARCGLSWKLSSDSYLYESKFAGEKFTGRLLKNGATFAEVLQPDNSGERLAILIGTARFVVEISPNSRSGTISRDSAQIGSFRLNWRSYDLEIPAGLRIEEKVGCFLPILNLQG